MNFQIGNIIELALFIAAAVGIYVKIQVKIKEFEMKLLGLEAKVKGVEHQDEKIMNRLDEMNESINDKLTDIKVQLQNKQNRNI